MQSCWYQMICHNRVWQYNQSSHLTGGTFGIPEKLLEGLLGWAKSQVALLHSFPLQMKLVQILLGMSFENMSNGFMEMFLR